MTTDASSKQVHQIYIQTTPELLWQALTDPSFTQQYYFHSRVKSDWTGGSSYEYRSPEGNIENQGQVLEAVPPRRLKMTYHAEWDPEVRKDPASTVTVEIEPQGGVCRLTLVHEDLVKGSATEQQTTKPFAGWPMITSSLKTLLETGKPLTAGVAG